eukprot:1185627-Prymnesium_polylepis.1
MPWAGAAEARPELSVVRTGMVDSPSLGDFNCFSVPSYFFAKMPPTDYLDIDTQAWVPLAPLDDDSGQCYRPRTEPF